MIHLLSVDGLRVSFATEDGVVQCRRRRLVRASPQARSSRRRRVGLRQERHRAPCMRLTRAPNAASQARCRSAARDLPGLSDEELRDLRGEHMSMVFQDPMTSLNPVYRVGDQIAETIRRTGRSRRQAAGAGRRTARLGGIPNAASAGRDYPHEFSGGMRQRVMIAMALALRARRPHRRRADHRARRHHSGPDPRAARGVSERARLAVVLITHDLGVVADVADRVAVMYAGQVVEDGDRRRDLLDPRIPTPGASRLAAPLDSRGRRLPPIAGSPDVAARPAAGLPVRAALPARFEECSSRRR